MKRLLIVHDGEPIANEVLANWRDQEPDRDISLMHSSKLAGEQVGGAGFFVAIGSAHLNFRRLEVLFSLAQKGVVAESFVSRTARVSSSTKIMSNTYVGPGAMIEPGCRIGNNVFIGADVKIGSNSNIKSSAWIGRSSRLGSDVVIGNYAVLGESVNVNSGINIGSYACVDRPMVVSTDIGDRTFYLKEYPRPIVTLRNPE
jgi:acetyltransferase-like isoleucine patch superfamily enzyme